MTSLKYLGLSFLRELALDLKIGSRGITRQLDRWKMLKSSTIFFLPKRAALVKEHQGGLLAND